VGYQGSAQVSVFTGGGRFLSSISNVAYGVTKSFKGELEGTVSAILRFAHIHDGESLEFVVGCYSQVGGTGKSVWIQSTDLTLSSDGKSYTTSAPSSQQGSTSGGGSSSSSGQQGSTGHQGSSTAGSPASALAADSSGMGTAGALGIAGGCVLLLALALGVIAYRRRNRSRLM
jgi:hypothetical protein